MDERIWVYHSCLRCHDPIQPDGQVWCDVCKEKARLELEDMIEREE